MTKKYTFVCEDSDSNSTTMVSFTTEEDRWAGFDGPMMKFFDFLRGEGFMFALNDEIGIMKENGEFSSAALWD